MGNQGCCGPRKPGQKKQNQEGSDQGMKKEQNGGTKQEIQQYDQVNDLDQLLQKCYKQGEQDLLTKRILPGRRSTAIAQNAGVVNDQNDYRQPISWDQKVITSKGQDTRVKIEQNRKYPFCSIGIIFITFLDKNNNKIQGFGTGCLIHKKTVLTCAHNVYDRERGLQAYQLKFVPAMDGKKGRQYLVSKVFYPPQYKNAASKQQHQWDFALMQLDTNDLSEEYGYLGINTMMNGSQDDAMLYGYPMDLNKQPGMKYLFGCTGRVWESKRSPQQLNYDMPTGAGQSGSPIIRKVGKDNYEVIGIHTRYIQAQKTGQRNESQQNCNSGVKFTDYCKTLINKWVQIRNKQLVLNKKTFDKSTFRDLMNKEWKQWKNLTRLNLTSNNITGEYLFYITSNDKKFPNLISLDLSDNAIDCIGMKHLTANYQAFPNLQELVLNHNKISTDGIKYLIQRHDCFPILSGLYLSENNINGKGIQELTKKQGAFPLLDNLDLGENVFEQSQSDSLALITIIYPNLTQFGIRRNGLGDNGMKKLFKNKKAFTNASQIGLANNLITGVGIQAMVDSGKNHFPNLTRLWLQNNVLQSDGAKWLARGNVFPNIVDLQVYSNGLGQTGVEQLTKIEGCFSKLQELGLQNNDIRNMGCKFLSMNWKAMPNLKKLYLDGNKITSQGIHNLIEDHYAYKYLTVLSLVGNQITSDGIKYLMYENQAFKKLQDLFLQDNQIGDEGVKHFSECLDKAFPNLKALGLRKNGITKQGVYYIAQNYKRFNTLRTIGLNMNEIDSQGIDRLIQANIKLPNLVNLWLAGNKLRASDTDKFKQKYPDINIK